MPGPKTNRNKKLTDKQPLPAAATSESEECKFDQEKFEAELSWCIEQLQKGLKSKKLTAKQGNFFKIVQVRWYILVLEFAPKLCQLF